MTIDELLAAIQAIVDGAEGRNLTPEELTQIEAHEAEIEAARASNGARDRQRARTAVADPTPVAPRAAVREPLPYNYRAIPTPRGARHVFNRGTNGHDLSTDLLDLINKRGDTGAAEQRLNAFIRAHFEQPRNADVDRADFASTNPNTYRPDLWQPQMDYDTPLWDMVASGDTDGRPFDVPKFNSSSNLVGPATEGTEPAGGTASVTSQTITPTQVWGKVEITRQAARRQGSPAMSGIIWEQMLREYYEEREQAVATFLNTLTAAADITLTGTPATTPDNDDDQVTVNDLETALVDLLFVRGGNRFRAFAVHQALYRVLARVKDDAGRALYPALGAQNANGTATALWRTLNINGTLAVPAWALGTPGTAAVNSWLFNPEKVRGWASTPERLDWNFGATVQTANIPQLSYVTIGIYGDVAFANLDINGVRQVIFDPSV